MGPPSSVKPTRCWWSEIQLIYSSFDQEQRTRLISENHVNVNKWMWKHAEYHPESLLSYRYTHHHVHMRLLCCFILNLFCLTLNKTLKNRRWMGVKLMIDTLSLHVLFLQTFYMANFNFKNSFQCIKISVFCSLTLCLSRLWQQRAAALNLGLVRACSCLPSPITGADWQGRIKLFPGSNTSWRLVSLNIQLIWAVGINLWLAARG